MEQQKALFIPFNQAFHGLVVRELERLNIKGYTYWPEVSGRGSRGGEPHLGTHAWPTLNGAILVICGANKVEPLLKALQVLDATTPNQGLRAFVFPIEASI